MTFGGLSKNYLAPGWRIGWGILSGDAASVRPYQEGINRLLHARLCANHPEQYAIPAALEGPQDHLKEVTRKMRSRRDLTVKWCDSTPRVSCVSPRGAFYAYPSIDIPEGDAVFVTELVRQKHVLVVHGPDLDSAQARTFPNRLPPRRKNPDQGLQLHRRFPERALSLAKLASTHPRATRALRRKRSRMQFTMIVAIDTPGPWSFLRKSA